MPSKAAQVARQKLPHSVIGTSRFSEEPIPAIAIAVLSNRPTPSSTTASLVPTPRAWSKLCRSSPVSYCSLSNLGFQVVLQRDRVVVLPVVRAVDESAPAAAGRFQNGLPRLGVRVQLTKIPPSELLPFPWNVAEPAAQAVTGCNILALIVGREAANRSWSEDSFVCGTFSDLCSQPMVCPPTPDVPDRTAASAGARAPWRSPPAARPSR